MAVRPWLKDFRQRLTRIHRTQPRRVERRQQRGSLVAFEHLEDRTLLAASVLFGLGELQILTDADESVTIQEDPAIPGQVDVQINGARAASLPTVLTADVTNITIITGSGDNAVDLSGVTALTFASSPSITVSLGDGHDTLTPSPDLAMSIAGEDGNDTITGSSADDTIFGDDGEDLIDGAAGNDSIDAGDGHDSVTGSDGNDTILGNDGHDTIDGSAGDDSIRAGDGHDSVVGNDGNDNLNGNSGRDTISGGLGDDVIFGGAHEDLVMGDDGLDTLFGNSGIDTLQGGAGNDTIDGGNSADSLLGEDGDDSINGMAGNDTLDGGGGADTIQGGAGNDLAYGDGINLTGITPGNDLVRGQGGNDTIIGTQGADTLEGGTGDDLIRSTLEPILDPPAVPSQPAPPPVMPPPAPVQALSPATSTGANGALTNPTTISNGSGDGDATFSGLDAVGDFDFGITFDPFGAAFGSMSNINFDSDIYLRVGTTGARTALSDTASTITGNMTEANSTFSNSGLDFSLVQTIDILNDGAGARIGSQLIQTYTITNPGTATLNFELVRYNEAHAFQFSSAFNDGGGMMQAADGTLILFESGGVVSNTPTPFVGITGVGGSEPTLNRFEYGSFGSITPDLISGAPLSDSLNDQLGGNADTNGDGFVDNAPFDAEVAIRNEFSLAPGASVDYTTHTLLGIVTLGPVNSPPVATADTVSTFDGSQITIDVVSNDTDADGVPIYATTTITSQPANGTAVSLGNGLVTYTPNPGFVGTDTFTYTIQDNFGAVSNSGTVTVNVSPTDTIGDTLDGGTGDDTILGAAGNDFINGRSGDDSLSGGDGNDTILGGAGADTISGGRGEDTLRGQGGNDQVNGGEGEDTIDFGGTGDGLDTIEGGEGSDTVVVRGTGAVDTFNIGQDANGLLTVTQGSAVATIDTSTIQALTLNAAGGADQITVGDLTRVGRIVMVLNGGAGNDTISAMGSDTGSVILEINGDTGNDTLSGGMRDDRINGGDDDDTANGFGGNDTVSGGNGLDQVTGDIGDDLLTGDAGNDTISGDDGDDVIDGGLDSDIITGGNGNDTLRGNFGDDALNGMAGNDSILGMSGRDTLAGGAGDDTLDGGREDDRIRGHSGSDLIRGDHGNDFITGDAGNDEIVGEDGDDTIMGGNGADGISGGDGNDLIEGQGMSDTITGGDGDDTLRGGGSDDTLLGEQGIDVLNGNSGTDLGSTGEGGDPAPTDVETIDESFVLDSAMMMNLDGV